MLVLGILALAVCWCWHTKSNRRRVTEYIFGSKELQQDFNNAQSGTARRLHFRADPNDPSDFLSGYTRGPEMPLSSKQMKRCHSLLQNASSYKWPDNTEKACIVNFGVLLTFKCPSQTLHVALCFQCNDLSLLKEAQGKLVQINKVGDFHPGRSGFVRLVKSIFLDDPEIEDFQ